MIYNFLLYLLKCYFQGHPTDLFLTISVLQRKFCWLGTEVSAVLLGSNAPMNVNPVGGECGQGEGI